MQKLNANLTHACQRRDRPSFRWSRVAFLSTLIAILSVSFCHAADGETSEVQPRLIGATATVVEVTTGLPFVARVDTGATTCSIHCEALEIDHASPDPKDNIGKPVRFQVRNSAGKKEWIESKIADHVLVRTSERDDERYKVRMKLRWQDVEKKVLVTLNDRERMKYPVLIGRNFLRGDFLVDVNLDGNE